jgi:hypothetical protein
MAGRFPGHFYLDDSECRLIRRASRLFAQLAAPLESILPAYGKLLNGRAKSLSTTESFANKIFHARRNQF